MAYVACLIEFSCVCVLSAMDDGTVVQGEVQKLGCFSNGRLHPTKAAYLGCRAGLVIGHTGHFPGGPTHFRGRQNVFFFFFFFFFFASSQWPIGLSPVLTA